MQSDDNADHITVGNIKNSQGVAVGAGATANVTILTAEQAYDVRGLANPYLGLSSFTYADSAKYAGREKLIADTVAHMTVPDAPITLLFVTGASGSGKSSFAQAGLLPALEKHYSAITVKHAVFRPGNNPLAALVDALWRQLGLRLDPNNLTAESFGEYLRVHTPDAQVNVIVIDQLEELFTQSTAPSRDIFFQLLAHLLPFAATRTHIIATMRSDYLPELFNHQEIYEIAKMGVDLRAMGVDELREAIQQPLRAAYPDTPKRFQSELVERLTQDAAQDAVYLPLLQVTLEEIWRKGSLTLGAYTNLGDAIKQRADQVLKYRDFDSAMPNEPRPQADQDALLQILLDLVNVSLDDEARHDVRHPWTKSALTRDNRIRERLIDVLAQARLLSIESEERIDLIHESLLTNWDRLSKAISEKRHELRQRARLEQNLNEWLAQNRSAEYLLDGARLAEARELESRDDIVLRNDDAKAFLRVSVDQAEAERQRELVRERQLAASEKQRARIFRFAAMGLSVLLFVAILASCYAFQQQNFAQEQQKISRSRELAAVAPNQLNVDPERALLIAIEANDPIQAAHTYESEDALRQAILASHVQAILRGHIDSVNSVAISPDGKHIVTGSRDQSTRIWDVATGREVTQLRGHTDSVNSVAFSPDGTRIVSGSDDQTARIWDMESGREVMRLLGHTESVISVAFSPDGKQIVTGSRDKTARIWDVSSGREVMQLLELTDSVTSFAFSLDGKQIAMGCGDGTAHIWDAVSGHEVTQLLGHRESVLGIAFSPDGKQVATGGGFGTVSIWDVASGHEVTQLDGPTSAVDSVAFSPDGKQIVTGSTDYTARIWDAVNGREVTQLRGHTGWVQSAAFSPDGKQIVTGSNDKTARIWDVASGHEVTQLDGPTSAVDSVAFSPDGKQIMTGSNDFTARIWDVSSGREVTHWLNYVAFSPDWKQIVTGSGDGTAHIWDAVSGREVTQLLLGQTETVISVVFSPDGKQVATGGGFGSVNIWDATSGRKVTQLFGHTGAVFSIAFSLDGKQIVTGSGDSTAHIWDLASGREVTQLSGHTGLINSVAFSPDGKRIVISSDDRTAHIWDVVSEREIIQLRGHTGSVTSVAFSPDGKQIVTGSGDSTARIWDAASGRELAQLRGHTDRVTSVAFSPDGKLIVTGSFDGTALVYYTHIEDLLALAKTRVTRDLTCEERVQYLHEERVCPTPTPQPTVSPTVSR